jgi:hypothetical protein
MLNGINVEWATLLVTLATGLLGGGWAVWKWGRDRSRERLAERTQLATRYVTPFLFACEDLQSRLYNLLCRSGLDPLRRRKNYPYAEETLYLVAQYFAYEPFILRYTPYGSDPIALGLMQRIRKDFASDRFGVDPDPWCIFRPRQKALGQLVLASRKGEQVTDVDVVTLVEFEELVDTGHIEHLYIEDALTALKKAADIHSLSPATRGRLSMIQVDLVDLLEYFEKNLAASSRKWLGGSRRQVVSIGGLKRERAHNTN